MFLARAVTVLLSIAFTCGSTEESLNFVVLGDWGGQMHPPYYTEAEEEIARVMGEKAGEINSQFTLALGDNFYLLGVENVEDTRFQTTFENVFTAASLHKPWYVVCGNHDHYGNASAEVAYTKVSDRWNMPDFYYTKTFDIPGSGATLQLINIDTVLLSGLTDPIDRTIPPGGPLSDSVANSEWEWIENTLESSTADWIIVAGHYPVWSIAMHGPTQILVDKLRPLLIKYNVTAYFCGHDHNVQHIKEDSSSVNYFVSGAGHNTNPILLHKDDIPEGSLKFYYAPIDMSRTHGSYNTVSVTEDTMTVTFIDAEGNELYSAIVNRTR